jgi:hypothetical protein
VLTITLLDNPLYEASETFTSPSAPHLATLGSPAETVITILDADVPMIYLPIINR